MGRACGTYRGEDKYIQGFGRERDHLEDPGVDGRITALQEVGWGRGID